jgi:esterase/lipase superfamily enzyme
MTQVFFATNRCPDNQDNPKKFGKDPCPGGLDSLRFGEAEVDGKKEKLGPVFVYPEKLDARPGRQKLGSNAAFDELRKLMMKEEADTLFFLHGFANTFESALIRAAQLKEYYARKSQGEGKKLNVLAFCWPSDGAVTPVFRAYADDRLDAATSGHAIARTMLKARDFARNLAPNERCNQRVHLLAHSMGNWALRNAMQALRQLGEEGTHQLFDQTILAAPDDDADTLGDVGKMAPIIGLTRRLTVYYSPRDTILTGSDWTKGMPSRLGATGPSDPHALPEKVELVNVAPVIVEKEEPNATEHQYYRNNDQVRDDIVDVLKGVAGDDIPNRTFRPEKRYYRLG